VVALVTVGALAGCATKPTQEEHPVTARTIAEGMSDIDLVGQVLMPSVGLGDAPQRVADLVRDYHLGGVILMGNVEQESAEASAAAVRTLTSALRDAAQPAGADLVPLIGTDQEYGWVTRIKSGIVQLPGGMAFGAAGRPELTEAAWRGAGAELAAVGINVDFAPDADVIGSPANTVIGSRSFGSDPAAVAAQVRAAVTGLESTGVAATLKHFPGHGHTDVNSHTALPVLGQSLDQLRDGDLPPFRAGIDAGASLVMSGHLQVNALDPGLPASFSDRALVDLLRTQLGFTGVVVTDALDMAPARQWSPGDAAVRAFLAGNDLLLMPPDLAKARDGLLAALRAGTIPRERMVESVTRIVALKLRLGASRAAEPALLTPAHREAARAVAAAAVTVLRGACTGPLVSGPVHVTASDGRAQQVAWLSAALRDQGVDVGGIGTRIHLVGRGDESTDLAPDAAVTVALDTPYLLASATSPGLVATYSSGQDSMAALAAVLVDAATAPGRSPVDVAGLPRSACAR
jgi:beta-N-acetylhexosaminidase